MNVEDQKFEKLYNNRFYVKRKISAGSFGVVFLCQDLQSKEYVAMKVEKEDFNNMSLDREIQMLEALRKVPGIPKIIWAGNEHNHNCLVMQLLGRDLSYHLKALKRFSLKCVVNVTLQILQIIEGVHRKGIIHRDMKPENVMTGKDQESNAVFLADFGIAKFFREPDGAHVSFKENKPFVGTTRYASINAHKGYELSRRDDLESIGYMIIYMFKGTLPWQTFHNAPEKDKTKLVGQVKQQTTLEELCHGCPLEFYQYFLKYFQYVKQLQFKSSPDYRYLYSLFEQISVTNGFKHDKRLDWTEFTQGTTKITLEPTQETKLIGRSTKPEDKNLRRNDGEKQKSELVNLQNQSTINNNRNRSRHQSEQCLNKSGNSGNSGSSSFLNSQQSSILLNYQNSQFSQNNLIIGSSKILSKLSERGLINKNNDSKGSIIQQQSSKSFHDRIASPQLQQIVSLQYQQSQHNNSQVMQYNENFEDLEELEERLQRDKKNNQRNLSHKNNKTLKVKEIQNHFQQNDNISDMAGMTAMDEDSLESKVKYYTFQSKLKQNLPQH